LGLRNQLSRGVPASSITKIKVGGGGNTEIWVQEKLETFKKEREYSVLLNPRKPVGRREKTGKISTKRPVIRAASHKGRES